MRGRPTIAQLLAEIEYGSEAQACEAAKLLADAKGTRLIAGLTRVLRSAEKPYSREAAAYALTWNKDRKTVKSLLTCASHPDELDSIRGQALEGLAVHLDSDAAMSSLRRKAEDLMMELLQSPSPTLRFWACFGLGTLGCRRAIPLLRKLKSTDKSVCPGWWYVREEAEDALRMIGGRAPKDRLPVLMRKQQNAKQAGSKQRRYGVRTRAPRRRRA